MFHSFYLAGFECATGWNMHGEWIDQIAATEHDLHVDADYERLEQVGIHAVREAIRWPLVDHGDGYDFSSVAPFVRAAASRGFDVIWDLFHYGYPGDLDPFGEAFAERFAAYCRAAARFVADNSPPPYFFTPVNEPSYFAWAAGEVARFAPHAHGRGFELKIAMARAAIAGIAAIRDEVPGARIVNVDPICRVVAGTPQHADHARLFNDEWVFEFWDMVSGRIQPELGGSAQHLDIVGINYYWTNQWELGRENLPLADDDTRRVSLAALVRTVWRRYGRDVVISETSALGDARAPWIHALSEIADQLLTEGVPLGGICLYPILGMPEWHARDQWARMGLWDIEREQDILQRKACTPMVEALQVVQRAISSKRYERFERDRVHTLARFGQAPLRFYGRLVWERRHAKGQSLRIYRCDHPHQLWIAATVLPTPTVLLDHVVTAAQLLMLLEVLQWLDPRTMARQHGIEHVDQLESATDAWRADLHEVGARALHLGARPAQPAPADLRLDPVPRGRRG